MSESKKYDNGKPMFAYAPPRALEEIMKAFTFGGDKYGAYNYMDTGFAYTRLFSATCRHIYAWLGGENLDPESGLNHLAHAGCCILMLLDQCLRGYGDDDRPPVKGESEEITNKVGDIVTYNPMKIETKIACPHCKKLNWNENYTCRHCGLSILKK